MLSNASLLLLHVSREAFFFISACMLTYAYAGLNLGADPAPAGRGGIFLCTSGTTGTPKGILLREDQLMHVAGSVAAHHRLTPADRGYCCLPLFHINAEVVGLLATLAAGACLMVDRTFSRRGFWELIEARMRCARRVRRRCRGPSGRPSSAWCRSCPSARRARSPGAVCGNWPARPADLARS